MRPSVCPHFLRDSPTRRVRRSIVPFWSIIILSHLFCRNFLNRNCLFLFFYLAPRRYSSFSSAYAAGLRRCHRRVLPEFRLCLRVNNLDIVLIIGPTAGIRCNHRLNSRYSSFLSLLPISTFIPAFLKNRSLGLLGYRTGTVLSFPVATDKVVWKVLFRFVAIFSGRVPIASNMVHTAAVFD